VQYVEVSQISLRKGGPEKDTRKLAASPDSVSSTSLSSTSISSTYVTPEQEKKLRTYSTDLSLQTFHATKADRERIEHEIRQQQRDFAPLFRRDSEPSRLSHNNRAHQYQSNHQRSGSNSLQQSSSFPGQRYINGFVPSSQQVSSSSSPSSLLYDEFGVDYEDDEDALRSEQRLLFSLQSLLDNNNNHHHHNNHRQSANNNHNHNNQQSSISLPQQQQQQQQHLNSLEELEELMLMEVSA
jgi:hypothetical protein